MEKSVARYVEFVQDVLISLHMNIRELQERKGFAEPAELAHIEGKMVAYAEVLSILRFSAKEFGIAPEEVGL